MGTSRRHPAASASGAVAARRSLLAALSAVLAGMLAAASASAIAPPDDPDYLRVQVQPQGALARINYPAALKTIGQTPLRDVPVAVLSSGLDMSHPDLAPRLVTFPAAVPAPDNPASSTPLTIPAGAHGWDMLGVATDMGYGNWTPDADPSEPPGQNDEGTLVAGALGQAFDNGIGGVGVAPNARFVALRTCFPSDGCDRTIQASAMRWAGANGVRVVSLSSGCCLVDQYVYGEAEAIAGAANTLFVTIATGNGNEGLVGDDRRPCGDASDNVLCVTTAAPDDGVDCGGYNPTIVDLAVPTQNSVSTANGGGTTPTICATSYAAPMAAGAAAVLFGLDPTASPSIVKQALIEGARPAPAWQGKTVSGGVLDLNLAVLRFAQLRGLQLVADGTPPPPPPPSPPPATEPPVIADVKISQQTISATHAATLRLLTNVPGAVTMSFNYIPDRKCPDGSKKPRPPKKCRSTKYSFVAKRSARVVRSGKIVRPVVAGRNKVRFNARISKAKRLAPGKYRVTVTVRNKAGVPSRKTVRTIRVTG